MQQDIVSLIIETAKELGEDEIGVDSELTADTQLFGDGGVLDSMGLVSLVIAVEEAIADRFDTTVGLADEKALSQANSPYRTVGTLADYAAAQMQEA